MPRLANGRGIRVHWTYTVAEAAVACQVHRNTVRHWIKEGLAVVSDGKPFLIAGRDLKAFLGGRKARRKRPLNAGEFYCLPCHAPKRPAGGLVDYEQASSTTGTLVGLCPDCGRALHRHVSRAGFDTVTQGLDVVTRSAAKADPVEQHEEDRSGSCRGPERMGVQHTRQAD